MVRVLVTVEPRMYREVIALTVQKNRPEAEVVLVPESTMDGQVDGFAPHVLVRNPGGRVIPERVLGSVVCRVEVLYTDSMAARVSVGGRTFTIEDASMGDLLEAVDEAAEIADIGKKIKGAATDAAKGKGSSDKQGKSTGGSGSGMDKAKSAVRNRLK